MDEKDEGIAATTLRAVSGKETPSQPYFSLVVPTIGRSEAVQALLESMTQSVFQHFEVIVVDQNSDDRLVDICRTYSARLPLQHMRVGFKGASRARNYGAKSAIGKIVTFPDDDCELTPSLLDQAKQLFESKSIDVLIGMCTDRSGDPSTTRFALDQRDLSLWNMWGRHAECTIFFDRATFLEAGGFDEVFGVGAEYGSDEGPELLIRLLRGPCRGRAYYSHLLRYYHPQKAKDFTQAGIERAFSYARGSGALLAKWPSLSVVMHSVSMVTRACIASFLFRGEKRRYYEARVRGFLQGFSLYRSKAEGTKSL